MAKHRHFEIMSTKPVKKTHNQEYKETRPNNESNQPADNWDNEQDNANKISHDFSDKENETLLGVKSRKLTFFGQKKWHQKKERQIADCGQNFFFLRHIVNCTIDYCSAFCFFCHNKVYISSFAPSGQ